jgi:plastocyanin
MRRLVPIVLLLLGAGPAEQTGAVTGAVVAVKAGKPVAPEYLFVYLQPTRPPRGKPPGNGHTYQIHQRNREFVPHVLVVPTGSVVEFPNDDKETHNVFSPNGPPEQFDLGRTNTDPKGPGHHFEDPGEVEMYCDIHKDMWAKIKVVDSPYVAQVVDGKYSFGSVAPGTYKVVAWAPSSPEVLSERITVKAGESITAKELHLQVAPIRTTHTRKDGKPYCPDGYSDC